MALSDINQVKGLEHFDVKNIKGGYRSVPTIDELNSITASHKEEGMLVYVNNTGKTYRLVSDEDGLLFFKKQEDVVKTEDASDEDIDALINN